MKHCSLILQKEQSWRDRPQDSIMGLERYRDCGFYPRTHRHTVVSAGCLHPGNDPPQSHPTPLPGPQRSPSGGSSLRWEQQEGPPPAPSRFLRNSFCSIFNFFVLNPVEERRVNHRRLLIYYLWRLTCRFNHARCPFPSQLKLKDNSRKPSGCRRWAVCMFIVRLLPVGRQ